MSSFGKKRRGGMGGSLLTRWLVAHNEASQLAHASPQAVTAWLSLLPWWTVIFSPAASSRQIPCAGLLVAVQQVNGQWSGLPSFSVMSFIISSSKSGWYCLGFLHMQALYSGSYPTLLGHQIMQKGRKMGFSSAPAWVNWNKKIMQIWSTQFSDAIQVPSQKS